MRMFVSTAHYFPVRNGCLDSAPSLSPKQCFFFSVNLLTQGDLFKNTYLRGKQLGASSNVLQPRRKVSNVHKERIARKFFLKKSYGNPRDTSVG